ncbi:MAG: nucleoside monophosphate kinase [Candidatus Pacebacteria bacterium]|nr:nucleoside monophosphate kinase [Candidatus Paceibacterota bacterium]
MKTFKIIILLGKSGSGKGTQAKLLKEKFNLEYIGSGDLLRKRAQKKDFTGKKILEIFNKGGLIPTPVILKLWLEKIEELKNKKNLRGIIMDGNPRKILEAYLIDEVFTYYEWSNKVKAILVDISDKEATNRLLKRRICKKCKEIIPYVGEFKLLKKCHKCGGSLINRSDDTKKSVQKRLAWFKKDVQPIINYYKKKRILVEINGEKNIEDVFKDVLKNV